MMIIIILEHLESLENFLWVAIGSYEVCVQDPGTYISWSLSIRETTQIQESHLHQDPFFPHLKWG